MACQGLVLFAHAVRLVYNSSRGGYMALIVMKVAFSFFNMECLWAEAFLSANPTLELS